MAFLIAFSSQLFCQLLKLLVYSAQQRRFDLSRLTMSGGFISSHSVFVCTLIMYLALTEGIGSPWFSVSMTFGIIVIHDAFRLRGSVASHARLLNKLVNELPEDRRNLLPRQTEQLGHNGKEVCIGILFGFAYGTISYFLFI